MKINSHLLRNLPTYWVEEGPENAPILLFIHGFPDDALAWTFQIQYFAKNFQVIAPFMPGVRDNHHVENERYQIDSLALDILQILQSVDASRIRPIIVIGHDLGGTLTYELKNFLGDRLKMQIFINSLGRPQFISRYKNTRQLLKSYYMYLFQIPKIPERMMTVFFKPLLKWVHNLAELPLDDEIRTRTPMTVLKLLALYREGLTHVIDDFKNPPPPCSIPTLFIWGERDSFLEIPSLDEIEKFHSQAELRVIDANHWAHRTHHQQVNMMIEKFIKGNPC